MVRRRAASDPGSLDLLLDTITNAFGGIVFLSILVAVLLRNTAKQVEALEHQNVPDLMQLAEELMTLREKLSSLNSQLKARESLAPLLDNPKLTRLLTQLDREHDIRDQLAQQQSHALADIAQTQVQINDTRSKLKVLEESIAEEETSLRDAKTSLDAEKEKRRVKTPFPQEKPTHKDLFNITIRYGRWYEKRTPDGEINLADFVVVGEEGEYFTITPRPDRGLPLLEGDHLSRQVLDRLATMDNHWQYAEIGIWDDSFDEFQLLRNHLVDHGIEYRLIPVTEGQALHEGLVPNPQVQ